MRPSSSPNENEIFTLNTRPEFWVVLGYLEDGSAEKPPIGPDISDFVASTGYRFRSQTTEEMSPRFATDPGESRWKRNAEFKVELQDIEFIRRAAMHTLNQKGILRKLDNKISRRHAAAKQILEQIDLLG